MHAEVCPVCNGTGKVKDNTFRYSGSSTTVPTEYICHGCNGKGWVEVNDRQRYYHSNCECVDESPIVDGYGTKTFGSFYISKGVRNIIGGYGSKNCS
ncbi:MAG: hypothetical protein GY861_22435 [bacterium]|nr:hypothetical protein [bacterium]